MNIFVHRASECLTDHEAHGDGLICFSLLNGLAERAHEVHAFANTAPIRTASPRLHVKTARHRVPANSLAPWEYSWRADKWLREVERKAPVDLVWRMHPYGAACPYPPRTGGRPLVVGPLFYGWPDQPGVRMAAGRPRLGVGLHGLVGPLMERGWHQTLQAAALIFCATEPHTAAIQAQYSQAVVKTLAVIVSSYPLPGALICVRRTRADVSVRWRRSPRLPWLATAVSFMNCPRCGLSIRLRASYLALERCPRCLARRGEVNALYISEQPGGPPMGSPPPQATPTVRTDKDETNSSARCRRA